MFEAFLLYKSTISLDFAKNNARFDLLFILIQCPF